MSGKLFYPDGKLIEFTKEAPPKTGNAYATWAGRNLDRLTLPNGGFLQFDLGKLRLSDFRQMSMHYQVNSSLNLLAFMQHQAKWKIKHSSAKVRTFLTEQLEANWTQFVRSRTQANWSGYSPAVLEWDNIGSNTVVTKVKDLVPEECLVNWKEVPLWAPPNTVPPKDKIYDGIIKFGQSFPIPVPNTFWYPLLMQNGDYYGRKLLRAVFMSYYFSMLMHLYANSYYERFGAPIPVGRAPFDDDIVYEGKSVSGSELMLGALQNLRARGVVLLPSDRVPNSTGVATEQYEYDIQYLESQIRGADFERHMQRLDQEIALGTFTPLLLQQTADVGSYNLGGLHYQMYLMTQNAMNDDWALGQAKYVLNPLVRYNFSATVASEPAFLEFEKQDNQKMDLVKMIIQAMISGGNLLPDIDELGEAAGLTLHEVQQVKTPTNPSQNDPTNTGDKTNDPLGSGNTGAVPAGQSPKPNGNNSNNALETLKGQVFERIRRQFDNAGSADVELNIPFTRAISALAGRDKANNLLTGLKTTHDFAVASNQDIDETISQLEKQWDSAVQ